MFRLLNVTYPLDGGFGDTAGLTAGFCGTDGRVGSAIETAYIIQNVTGQL